MLFINTGQLDNKLDAKLKKQEIVFDTAVFHFELTYDNKGFVEYQKALESRYIYLEIQNCFIPSLGKKHPCQSELGFSLKCFHSVFCLRFVFPSPDQIFLDNQFQKDMILKNMGMALRFCIPQMIGRKVGEFWELIKPLVDFKYEVRILPKSDGAIDLAP